MLKYLNKKGLTERKLQEKLKELTENIYRELQLHFPKLVNSSKSLQLFQKYRQKVLLQIDEVIDNKDYSDKINKVLKQIIKNTDIFSFTGFGDHLKYQKNFEKICSMLQKDYKRNIKEFTVLEYYTLLDNNEMI